MVRRWGRIALLLVLIGAPAGAADGELDDDDFHPPNGFRIGPVQAHGTGAVARPAAGSAGAIALAYGKQLDPDPPPNVVALEWVAVTENSISAPCTLDLGIALHPFATAFDDQGRLLITGRATYPAGHRIFVARYLYPGCVLDTSFDGDGFFTFGALAAWGVDLELVRVQLLPGVLVQRLLIAAQLAEPGEPGAVLLRLRGDGTLDTTFGGGDGVVTLQWNSGLADLVDLAVDASGRILLTGAVGNHLDQDIFLVRRLPAGGADTSFGLFGSVVFHQGSDDRFDWPAAVVPAPNGDLYLAGTVAEGTYQLVVNRLSTSGGRLEERSWSAPGSIARAAALRAGDRLILAGTTGLYDGDPDLFTMAVRVPGLERDPAWGHAADPEPMVYLSLDLYVAEGAFESLAPGLTFVDARPLVAGYSRGDSTWVPWVLRLESDLLFRDDFESGSTASW